MVATLAIGWKVARKLPSSIGGLLAQLDAQEQQAREIVGAMNLLEQTSRDAVKG